MSRIGQALKRRDKDGRPGDRGDSGDSLGWRRWHEVETPIVPAWQLERFPIELPGTHEAPPVTPPAAALPRAVPDDPATKPARFRQFSKALAGKVVGDRTMNRAAIEQYRRLAASLHHVQVERGTPKIMITSAVSGEGKTLTALNLAVTLSASYRRRVVLIDANLRSPSVHALLDTGNVVGLSDVLGDARHAIASPLLGSFNIDNLLAVAGVLHALGESDAAIVDALPRLQPIPGRMNRLGGHGGLPLVVIDYSHKPDPLQQALASLRGHLRGRLVCVFGCGGERDRGKRPQMARIAEDNADIVIVTDDNPRGEDGDAIVADIVAGFARPGDAVVERDRRRAIERAIGQAGPDDIVLVAGKGHETYQEVAGVKHAFDDTQVARAALGGRA